MAKRAKIGVARRLVIYITRPDALECDGDGNPIILANVGEDVAEQAAAFDLIETLARSSRGNAKVVFSMIVNLPHDVSPQARCEILRRFCTEAFDLHDLPYVATIHTPPPSGDERNFHAHIAFGLRPMHRVGDHEWNVAPRLATEFDGEARFTYLRALFAQTMTEVTQAQGTKRVYTHLSNAARGLTALPLSPLGPALTQAVRDGDIVGVNEQNRQRIAANETLLAKDRERWRAERKAERDLIDERYRQVLVTTKRGHLPMVSGRATAPRPVRPLTPSRLPLSSPAVIHHPGIVGVATSAQCAFGCARCNRRPLPIVGYQERAAIQCIPLPNLATMPSPLQQPKRPLPVLAVDASIRSDMTGRMAVVLRLLGEAVARGAERAARKRREAAKRQRSAAPDITDR